ncbi:MAG: hypothetical protein HZB15_05925, partial [Actinobacteria bacterium]|nr:hypothetical protein [Actinomycetota bacterium]
MRVGEHSVEHPEPSQPSGEASCPFAVSGAQQPLERSPVLRDRTSKQLEPGALIRATYAALSSLGKCQVVLGVAAARLVGVEIGQQVGCIRAQGVEQPEPVGAGHRDHRLTNQIRQDAQRIVAAGFSRHRRGGVEIERRRKDSKSGEESTVFVVEQICAPGHCSAKRLLTRRDIACAIHEKVEAVLQPLSDGAGRQHVRPRRG